MVIIMCQIQSEKFLDMDAFIQLGIDSALNVELCDSEKVWDELEQIIVRAENKNK